MRDLTLNDWLNAVTLLIAGAATLYAPWIVEMVR